MKDFQQEIRDISGWLSKIGADPSGGMTRLLYTPEWIEVCRILRALQREPLRTGKILNINVPDLPLAEIKGLRVTRCGSRHPADKVFCQQDPRGQNIYWIGPPGDKFDAGPDTDFAAVEQGYVAITPLQVDLTAYAAQEVVKTWLTKAEVSGEW